MLTLKDHVSGDAEFQYYRAGNLIYKTSTGLEFPIPISDADGSFNRVEKGLTLMRWIRKYLQENGLMRSPKSKPSIDVSLLLLAQEIEDNERGFSIHTQHKFTP